MKKLSRSFRVIPTLLAAALLCGACTRPKAPQSKPSSYVRENLAGSFATWIRQDETKAEWEALSRGNGSVYSNLAGTVWLTQTRSGRAVYADRRLAPVFDLIALDLRELIYADMEQFRLLAAGKDADGRPRLYAAGISDLDWQPLEQVALPDETGEGLILADGQSADGGVWIAAAGSADAQGAPLLAGYLDFAANSFTDLSAEVPAAAAEEGAAELQLAALHGRQALLAVGRTVYKLDAGGTVTLWHEAAEGLRYSIAADRSEPGSGWIYLRPQLAAEGTGRAEGRDEPGQLIVKGPDGSVLSRMTTGATPFGAVSGDWKQREAYLVQSRQGVVHCSLADGSLRWVLRQDSAAPLQLTSSGTRLSCVLPDAAVQIKLDELPKLAESMMALKSLPRDSIARLGPVFDDIGWAGSGVQVSPLLDSTGRLTLFDSSTSGSLGELDWSAERSRVERLLVSREAAAADAKLPGLSPEARSALLRGWLKNMGWPEAEEISCDMPGEGELRCIWRLRPLAHRPDTLASPVPEGKPESFPGLFEYWSNEDAVLISLKPAADPLPAGSLPIPEIRKLALRAAVTEMGRANLPPASVRISYSVTGRWLPDADGAEPRPVVEVKAWADVKEGKGQVIFVVLLDALTGKFVDGSSERVAKRELDGVFGPPDEFGPLPE